MHAHKCTVCEARGVQTVWIHGDEEGGNKAAHKCPKCGSENWQKFMIEVGKLPQQAQQQQGQRSGPLQLLTLSDALMMAFTYAILVMLVVAVAQNWDKIISYLAAKAQK